MSESTIAPLLTQAAAAKLLGLSVRSLERHRIAGTGPRFCQISERRIAYEPAAISEWLASRRRSSTSDRGARPAA